MVFYHHFLAVTSLLAPAYGQQGRHRPSRRQETATTPTELTDCHLHDTTQYCMAGAVEYEVLINATTTADLPTSYSDCHSHGTELYCVAADGTEVQVVAEGTEVVDSSDTASTGGQSCHFHAGVEHCVGADGAEVEQTCERVSREYQIPIRIGGVFILLVAGAIGAMGPILLSKWSMSPILKWATLILKQFGTGVIISTAFVHLFTHANIMFANECLGELQYEATAAAIFMAGLFLTFVIEYTTHRIADGISAKKTQSPQPPSVPDPAKEASVSSASVDAASTVPLRQHETAGVLVLEGGIVFHSLIIGVTLVVAGDSFFRILLVVITFHQFFEGIALGSRIAVLKSISLVHKLLMAAAFALTTPVGMAIGIGVLDQFNGNSASTLIAMGTLNAFSSGILAWSGVVEMWAGDWMVPGGEMVNADPKRVLAGGFSLMAGMILMSFIGKWA